MMDYQTVQHPKNKLIHEKTEDNETEMEDIEKVESYVSSFTFRYNYFYICLIFLLLFSEWFYRKKFGLI